MKPGTNQRRSRGRSGGGGNNPNSGGNSGGSGGGGGRRPNRNQSYDSNGPDVKVRGTAQQVLDKYLQLARDSQSGGDRVKAEAYLQFAEHYYRLVNVEQESSDRPQRTEQGDQGGQGGDQARNNQSRNDQPRQNNQPRDDQPRQAERVQVETIAIEQAGGDQPIDSAAPAKAPVNVEGVKPPRARRRAAHVKNEATLAAEAAAANETRNKRKRNEDVGEAVVESTIPVPAPRSDDDDDLDAAANG